MRKVEFVPFVLNDSVGIYSIVLEGDRESEMEKFILLFRETDDVYLKSDYKEILKSLLKISENGVKESFFRYEGKMDDRICAIPLYVNTKRKTKATLRLYCIRLSQRLLIIGGGGIKVTRTYEEDESLLRIVRTLQQIDKQIGNLEAEGVNLENELCNLVLKIK